MTLSKEKLLPLLPALATLLLLGLIAVQLANLTLQLFFETEATQNAKPGNVQAIVSNKRKSNPAAQLASQVSQKHLFGIAGTVEAPKQEIIDAPETKLDLILKGILATGDKLGLAIISKGRQKEKMYKIGDELPDNAELKSVYSDRVLIESSRGLETLRIELDKNRLTDITVSEGNLAPPGRTLPKQSNNKFAELRKEILRNPLSFTKKISIKPQKDESGKLLGYELKPRNDKALFEELGLQSGDIATAINGLDLSDNKNARRAMNILRRSKKINMTVMRNGQEIKIEQQL